VQKFCIVTAKGFLRTYSIICEEQWVEATRKRCLDFGFHKDDIEAQPAVCHWSAQVLPRREFSDWDQKTEE
jgi:hypothetical protein